MYVKSQKIDFLTYSIQEVLNLAKELWVAKVFLAEKSRVLDLEYPFGHDCDDFFCENFVICNTFRHVISVKIRRKEKGNAEREF